MVRVAAARHRFAHIGGQWHSLDPVALASDDQFPSAPINIVEAQRSNLAWA
jgi:hypothetical protein